MRRLVVLTIAGGLIAGSFLQADDTVPAKKGTWFPTFKAAAKAEDSQKSKAKDTEALDELEVANAERAARRKKIAGQIDREEQDYFRRLEVCDRLMDQAIREGDQDLVRKLEQMQERIQQVYDRNTASLGIADPASLDLAILKDKTSISKTTTAQLLKDEKSKKGSQSASRKEKP
jgi:hypothetical protein